MLSTIVRSSVCNDASERKLKYADGAAYLNSKNTDMHPAHTTKLSAEENLFFVLLVEGFGHKACPRGPFVAGCQLRKISVGRACGFRVSVTKVGLEDLLRLVVS